MRNLKSRTEVRDGLIRLLAEENLNVVRHGQPAAFFDLKTRTVNVPNWDFEKLDASDAGTVMDVHEVLHAILTPDTHTVNATRNILEDIRIERIGKQKFPGIRQIFLEGYRQLFDKLNFFKLKDTPLSELNEMNFLDRLNLHAKVGFLLPLPLDFSPEEKVLLERAFKTETFDDILKLEIDIKRMMKDQQDQSQTDQHKVPSPQQGEGSGEESDDKQEMQGDGEESNEDDADGNDKNDKNGEDGDKEDETEMSRDSYSAGAGDEDEELPEPTSETLNNFDSAMDGILSADIPAQIQVGSLTKEFVDAQKIVSAKELVGQYAFLGTCYEYDSLIGSATRSAQVLYKEFMLRKNAKERQFDTIRDSGKLDMKRIHLSAFTDNIFRQKTTVFQGANHGFVFLLDISGSMQGQRIRSTLSQLFIVTEFCRKANIKFKVYTFTAGLTRREGATNAIKEFDSGNAFVYDTPDISAVHHAGLCEVLSSTLNGAEHKTACRGLYHILCARHFVTNRYFRHLYAGTSTCMALLSVEGIARQFFDENKIEKRNLILMSDGGAGDSLNMRNQNKDARRYFKINITDIKTKKTYPTISSGDDMSDIVLNMVGRRIGAKTSLMQLASSVKEGVYGAKIIRKFIETKHSIKESCRNDHYSSYGGKMYEACTSYQTIFNKQKFVKFSDHTLINSVYIIKMVKTEDVADIDDMFDAEDAQKKSAAQIASKLISSNKTEKASRVLMQTMAESFN